jgi:hypothetical protein
MYVLNIELRYKYDVCTGPGALNENNTDITIENWKRIKTL